MKKALLIALTIAVAGGVWIFRAQHNQSNQQTTRPTTQQNPPVEPQKTAQQYLVISQWGIKLPLSDDIADAYYVVSTSSQDAQGKPNTMWLGLKSLDDVDSCAADQANHGGTPLGALIKAAAAQTGKPHPADKIRCI